MGFLGNSPELEQLKRQADAMEDAAKGAADASIVAAEAAKAAKTSARAAWVQAIGSVLAISVAVAIPAYQNSVDAKRAAKIEREQTEGAWIQVRNSSVDVIDILMDSKRQIQAMKAGEQATYQFPAWLFDDAREGIRAVPFHQLDDKALMVLTDIRQALGEVRRFLLPLDGKRVQGIVSDQTLHRIDEELKRVSALGEKASKGSGRYPSN